MRWGWKLYAIVWALFMAASIGMLFAESHPPTATGRALQVEMDGYVETFLSAVGITDAALQWTVFVLPVLEDDGPAIIYGWLIPPEARYVEGGHSVWVAMFTFHEDMMLMLEPRMRRVIAGHEVAHMMTACRTIEQADPEGLDEVSAIVVRVNNAVLVESCADIVSAQLTSAKDVLHTLLFLNKLWGEGNVVLHKRIAVMQQEVAEEVHNVE